MIHRGTPFEKRGVAFGISALGGDLDRKSKKVKLLWWLKYGNIGVQIVVALLSVICSLS